jgi:hypothetical protein
MRTLCPTVLYIARDAVPGLASTAMCACWGSGADVPRALRYPRHIHLRAGCRRRPVPLNNSLAHGRRLELIIGIADGWGPIAG